MRPIQCEKWRRERKSRMFVCVCMWYRVYIYGKMGQLRYRMCKSVWVHARTTYNKHSFHFVCLYILWFYIAMIRIHARRIYTHSMSISGANAHCTHQIPKNFIGKTFVCTWAGRSVKLENGTSDRDTHFTMACFVCVSLFAAFRIEWTNWRTSEAKEENTPNRKEFD